MDDQTVIRPMPGGRKPRNTATPERRPAEQVPRTDNVQHGQPWRQSPAPEPDYAHSGAGTVAQGTISQRENPLLQLVTPLLSFLGKIQNTAECPDLEEFHRYALDQIQLYESQGWGVPGGRENSEYISYPLCALIDEIVLNTPWGSNSRWGSESLLITRHQEAWGGERFFNYLNELMKRPATNLELLEFYFACLSLGFEGKYRRMANGRRELDRLRSELYILISRHRNYEPEGLSPHWEGVSDRRIGIARYLPFWVIWAFSLFLLMAAFLGFIWKITQESDQVMQQFAGISNTAAIEVTPVNIDRLVAPLYSVAEPDLVPEQLDYFALLEPELVEEIAAGTVELIDEDNQVRLRLRHARLFPSGQADLSHEFVPLVERIGTQLKGVGKPIIVEGHSDNVPIFSTRYPSNWALSQARAKSVAEVLLSQLEEGIVMRVEGKASSAPLVENNSNLNRALNRRVEILLRK
ncbi:type IVB secretion system protein IcmH/DotU [Amphritea pacifica]|uniref:type IVB secretion system protein IcmH/DotU n=1 Tax=Amphritea pacifica TaxID=2811233 RepID=UPI001963DB0F|nr:type IVB secretion system protein IcmH/DotU [Amphritea pacifica]MBN1006349.1 type IVB secretion system protein IcmH/DotU [Amphritea pacifica]